MKSLNGADIWSPNFLAPKFATSFFTDPFLPPANITNSSSSVYPIQDDNYQASNQSPLSNYTAASLQQPPSRHQAVRRASSSQVVGAKMPQQKHLAPRLSLGAHQMQQVILELEIFFACKKQLMFQVEFKIFGTGNTFCVQRQLMFQVYLLFWIVNMFYMQKIANVLRFVYILELEI